MFGTSKGVCVVLKSRCCDGWVGRSLTGENERVRMKGDGRREEFVCLVARSLVLAVWDVGLGEPCHDVYLNARGEILTIMHHI